MNQSFKLSLPLSFGEEVGNAVTHAISAFIVLTLLPFSAIYSYEQTGLIQTIGVSIFIISLFLMFLSSTIYHSMAYGSTHKYILRIIDHSMIYIAIAGSYTPVLLSLMPNWLGYLVLGFQWTITILGILYKIFTPKVNERFSLALYLIMGWLVLLILPPVISKTGPAFWSLMLAGGIAYSIGAIFYAKKKPYFHMIWHLFIILASFLQYLAIVFYMV